MNHKNSWKNCVAVFDKQLALNEEYLTSNKYPPHWFQFITLMKFANTLRPIATMLDIGCGSGSCSELCQREFPNLTYHGVDYSSYAIELATRKWSKCFKVMNLWDMTAKDIKEYDLIHTDALFDVMPDGDEAVEFLFSLKPSMALLNRLDISTTGQATAQVYQAYDLIPTYAYRHDPRRLLKAFSGYHIINEGNAFLLWH